ncbi:MAG: DUF72 domain-containing protein [Phycisphaerae bacterium]
MSRQRDDPRQRSLFAKPAEVPAGDQPAASAARSVNRPGPDHAGQRRLVRPAPPLPEHVALAGRLNPLVYLGTSSWSFPGWAGIVYDREATEQTLARQGLTAYSAHPLFRTVGIDRTFYAPISREQFARYAADVPEHFRFLCKAYDGLTSPTVYSRGGARGGGRMAREMSPHFLDASYAAEQVVAPMVEGLGPKAGPLVFQFTPMSKRALGDPRRFIDRLAAFLTALPRGPLYAVELRNAELLDEDFTESRDPADADRRHQGIRLCDEYRAALAAGGAVHCYNVHPSMPSPREQAAAVPLSGPLVVRWMLNHKWNYDATRTAYAPFDRLVDEDAVSRAEIAELCGQAVLDGRHAFMVINNKAEGCAPRSVFELAERIVNP